MPDPDEIGKVPLRQSLALAPTTQPLGPLHARTMQHRIEVAQGDSMQRRIKPADTLASVKSGESRYDEAYADRARKELRRFVDERNQTEAARLLGVSQGTISRNLDPDRQPTFRILIRLAQVTHRTIDDLIGLRDGGGTEVRLRDGELMRVAEMVAQRVASKLPSEPPPAPKARKPRQRKK